ncbi:MAG: V-type ATP synthase subunit A [Synergistaceae bacterium]|jgi:V/A-type H+-transporting ATPase subunit A|nr:V-type ATP synthase subunit A [Synergistaceae bacterium]
MFDGARTARVREVSGSLAVAEVDSLFRTSLRPFESVRVGKDWLIGEVLEIRDAEIVIQLYENAAGLSVGEEVLFTGEGLSVDLGPGFLGEAVNALGFSFGRAGETDLYLERGFRSRPAAPRAEKQWHFRPSAREGDRTGPGGVLGTAAEGHFFHRVMVPPCVTVPPSHAPARVAWIAPEGDYTARETVCRLSDGKELSMTQRWEIRVPRPVRRRLSPDGPFVTGQSALDALFPLALGGTAVLSGEPGTGKTLLLQSLARCRGADAVVCVLCGERGTEAAEVLEELSKTMDSRGESQARFSLMDRTALIVSTSDMPLATREASVCLGMTLAEYYRDMGYDAAVLIDSASRCAEALAETGARLRGRDCPEYGVSRLSACFGRAGRAEVLRGASPEGAFPEGASPEGASPEGMKRGSVTLIGTESEPRGSALSPLNAPGAFWRLDRRSARACRFPALDLSLSYSLYGKIFPEEAGEDWPKLTEYLKDTLRHAVPDAFPKREWSLFLANTLDAVFMRQEAGSFRSAAYSAALLRFLKALDEAARKALSSAGRRYADVAVCAALPELLALRGLSEKDFADGSREWLERFVSRLESLPAEFSVPETLLTEGAP